VCHRRCWGGSQRAQWCGVCCVAGFVPLVICADWHRRLRRVCARAQSGIAQPREGARGECPTVGRSNAQRRVLTLRGNCLVLAKRRTGKQCAGHAALRCPRGRMRLAASRSNRTRHSCARTDSAHACHPYDLLRAHACTQAQRDASFHARAQTHAQNPRIRTHVRTQTHAHGRTRTLTHTEQTHTRPCTRAEDGQTQDAP
jgi:hypothetical protein